MVFAAESTTARREAAPAAHRTVVGRAASFLVSLPDRLTSAFLAVSVVVSLFLLASQFRPWLVLPFAVIALVAGGMVVPKSIAVNRASMIGVVAAVAITVLWCLAQRGHTAEMIGLDRDPAQYTLSALWLIHHASPDIAVNANLPDLAIQVPGVVTDFLQGNTGAINHVQGNDLLPGLLGLAGWLRGPTGVFTGNIAIAGVALMALYALTRRVLGPLWGLAPLVLLAVTMPLAAFARMPYTEPTALVFVSGMLTALWVAIQERRAWLFALSGAFAGATMMARIDGGLTIVAASVTLSALAIAPALESNRQQGRRALLFFALGAVPAVALSWLDLKLHSPQYLRSLSKQIYPVIGAIPLVLGVGLLLSRWRRFSGGIARWLATHKRLLLVGGTGLVGLGTVVMVTRPWWMTAHYQYNHDGLDYVGSVAARQKIEGLPIDGTQSYDEMTINWLAWYLSWPIVGFALLGAVLATVSFLRERNRQLFALWFIFVLVAGFYLNNISITADQIWAARRLLPVIIPATAIGAVFGMKTLVGWLPRVRWLGVLASVVLVSLPVMFWGKPYDSREGAGEYAFLQQICSLAGPNALIVQAGPYPITGSMLPALQELCTDKAIQVNNPSLGTMQAIRSRWNGPVVVVAFFPDAVSWSTPIDPAKPLAKVVFNRWESVISHRPEKLQLQQASAWLGTIDEDGYVTSITAQPFPALLGY